MGIRKHILKRISEIASVEHNFDKNRTEWRDYRIIINEEFDEKPIQKFDFNTLSDNLLVYEFERLISHIFRYKQIINNDNRN